MVAEHPDGTGSADGTGSEARFHSPQGITVDSFGNAYVADTENHTIRKVTPTGLVTTLAGNPSTPIEAFADGIGSEARFFWPSSVGVDGSGNIYVSEWRVQNGGFYDGLRKVDPIGVVTTLELNAPEPETSDGRHGIAFG